MTREELLEKGTHLRTLVFKTHAKSKEEKLISDKWSDDEVVDQLRTYFESIQRTEKEFTDYYNSLLRKLAPGLPIEEVIEQIRQKLHTFFGWDNLVPMDADFWVNFFHTPYNLLNTLYDGMPQTYFSDVIRYYGYIYNNLHNFNTWYKNFTNYDKLKREVHNSPYINMDEMEEELSVKRIGAAAKEFYLDKTKNFEERVKVFTKYGKKHGWIWQPQDFDLGEIFSMYCENSERHESVDCAQIIEWWIDSLSYKRTFIDYSKNKYHPKLKQEYRDYEPSKEACDRLHRYYMEKLFLFGVGSFEIDW